MLRILPQKLANFRFISLLSRVWSGTQGSNIKYTEEQLKNILKSKFPNANKLNVTDVSGGCGAMFEILVIANEFKGIPIIKQHRMITELLKNEIKDMHGIRIHTETPDHSTPTSLKPNSDSTS